MASLNIALSTAGPETGQPGKTDLPARAAPESGSAAPPDAFLDRPDGRIAYSDQGSGPLVVLVPGLGDLKEEYRLLAPMLVDAGYRAVAMDLRGHGGSSTGWSDYSAAAIGSDIVALIAHLDAGPATVIGTSMGAGAAAWAAADAPELIDRLVLIGPFVRDITLPLWKQALFATLTHTAFVGPWAPSAWGAYYASLYPSAKPDDFDSYKARLVANLREDGRMAAVQAMLVASKADVEARLADVRAPALVVMGTKDPDFADPAEEAETVARLVRGSTVTIDGAGHYPHAEMPEKTGPAILDFLATERAA